MYPDTSAAKTTHSLERALAIAGCLISVALTVILWISIGANQGMWPLPGLYFI